MPKNSANKTLRVLRGAIPRHVQLASGHDGCVLAVLLLLLGLDFQPDDRKGACAGRISDGHCGGYRSRVCILRGVVARQRPPPEIASQEAVRKPSWGCILGSMCLPSLFRRLGPVRGGVGGRHVETRRYLRGTRTVRCQV